MLELFIKLETTKYKRSILKSEIKYKWLNVLDHISDFITQSKEGYQ